MSAGAKNYSKDNEYYTPKEIVSMFGSFDYDPATTPEKAEDLGVQAFDTIETDGLKTDWKKYKRIWINPPFTKKKEFLAKAVETYEETSADIYVLLPIEFLTTKKFHDICRGGLIYLPNGRIKFESGLGKDAKNPAFGSVVVKIQKRWGLKTISINKKGDENAKA